MTIDNNILSTLRQNCPTSDSGCEPQRGGGGEVSYKRIDTESPPYFVNSSRSLVYTTLGRTVILECRVRNLGNRAVSADNVCWLYHVGEQDVGWCQASLMPFSAG